MYALKNIHTLRILCISLVHVFGLVFFFSCVFGSCVAYYCGCGHPFCGVFLVFSFCLRCFWWVLLLNSEEMFLEIGNLGRLGRNDVWFSFVLIDENLGFE